MVKAYILERVQQRLQEATLLSVLPSDCAPLCCALSAGGRVFLASSQRSIAVFDVGRSADQVAAAALCTVGVPQSVLYNECGNYLATIEATAGAGHASATEVFAYVGCTPAAGTSNRRQHPEQPAAVGAEQPDEEQEAEHHWLRSIRICLVDVENEAKEKEVAEETGIFRGGGSEAASSGWSLQRRRVGPTVHRFPVSGSSPALAVCPISGRLAVGDAGAVTVYDYVSGEDRFVAEWRVALPFLAAEVAVLAGRAIAAAGDSRLVIAWSRRLQPPSAMLPCALTADPLSRMPACGGSRAVDDERPSSVLLPSMLRCLHDRHASAFELAGGDAESVPTPDVIGSAVGPLVLYKRFNNDQELHSLAMLPVGGVCSEPSEAIAFVSSKHSGYLYAVSEGRAQPLCDFTYVGISFKVLLSSSILTVCTTSGIELYTNKVCPKEERDLFNQICADIKYPVLVAMKDVKGLVHCIANSTTTCYFTDHWEAFINPSISSLSAELLLLSQALVASSVGSAVQVATEGLLACRLRTLPAFRTFQECDAEGERVIDAAQRGLCLLVARSLMVADDRGVTMGSGAAETPSASFCSNSSARDCSVVAFYDIAGIMSMDVALGNCLAAGSSCAARVALKLLFRDCTRDLQHVFEVPSLTISRGILSLIAKHCPSSLNHVLFHLMQHHQLLKEKSAFVMSSTDDADVYGVLCEALSAFYAGRAEDVQAIVSDAKQQMAGKLADVLASHTNILIAQSRLTDFAQYLRSLHTDLFVAVLLELVSKHSLAPADVLCVLNSSCGVKSYDKKLYLEALAERATLKSAHLDPLLAKELCQLLMDAVSNTACSGTHLTRHDAYCITQITTDLARFRPSWLNDPSLYPPIIHQMCIHKFGTKPPYVASKNSDSRVTVVGRWLCTMCHADLLKLQGLLCCGLMSNELVEITVRELLSNASPESSSEEPAAALSLQLLNAVANWTAAVDCGDSGAQQEAIGPDLLALLVARCPAVLSLMLRSLPQSCSEQSAVLIEAVLRELGKRLATTSSDADGLLKALQDVMKQACNLMTFDRLLMALPPNGSVAYFLPYLEHSARRERPPYGSTD